MKYQLGNQMVQTNKLRKEIEFALDNVKLHYLDLMLNFEDMEKTYLGVFAERVQNNQNQDIIKLLDKKKNAVMAYYEIGKMEFDNSLNTGLKSSNITDFLKIVNETLQSVQNYRKSVSLFKKSTQCAKDLNDSTFLTFLVSVQGLKDLMEKRILSIDLLRDKNASFNYDNKKEMIF